MFNKLQQIQLDSPVIGEHEKLYLERAVSSGYVSTAGPFVPEFEDKFCGLIGGVKGAVSTQSGTAALHMALCELGIGPGDEVIVPVLTFIATINPIKYIGAVPVFVDINKETWNIDIAQIKKAITDKTKAIIPVHLYGNPCNTDEIIDLAKEHNIAVIEDAAQSLGAKFKGKPTGTFGDLGCFSFNGNKIITTGGGGMVVGNKIEQIKHIKFLVNQAKDEARSYYHPEIGFNYRMTNLEAALGLAQLERLEEILAKKKRINQIYKNELANIKAVRFQEEYLGAESSFWFSCLVLDGGVEVSGLQKELKKQGIPTRRTFMPIVEFPPYKQDRKEDYQNAYSVYDRGLCLPSSALNSDDDIDYVCEKLKELIK